VLANSRTRCSRTSREASGSLCSLAHAAIALSGARLAKYSIALASGERTIGLRCALADAARPNGRRQRLAARAASSLSLARLVVREEDDIAGTTSTRLHRDTRADGSPLLAAGRDDHRSGFGCARARALAKPLLEQRHRIARQWLGQHRSW
jgi:hypothetical protein